MAFCHGLWRLKNGSFFTRSLARLMSTSVRGWVGRSYFSMSYGVTPRKRAVGTQKNSLMCAALPLPTFSVR